MDITTFTRSKLLVPGLLILILIALATLPLYGGPLFGILSNDLFLPFIIMMYAVLAVSWAMFSGPTGYMSLAVGAFFGVGVYTTVVLHEALPIGVIVAAAGLVTFLVALLVGRVTLRLKGIYFAIFTFGLVVLLGQLVLYYEIHILGIRGQRIPPISYEAAYYLMLTILVAALVTIYFIRRSRLGLAMQSIGGNEEAAAHMGVNTTMVKVTTFAISAIFMGAAGAAYAARMIFIDPNTAFNLNNSFAPVLMAVFGGMGQLYGPVIGATVFGLLEDWLSGTLPHLYTLIFGIVLITAILYMPGGLAGLVPNLRNRLRGVVAKLRKGGQGEQHANT